VTWNPQQLRRGAHHNWAGKSGYCPYFVFYTEWRAPAIVLKFSGLVPGWHCPRQAENATRGISQVLTAAVVLAMVCPLEIAVLRILIFGVFAALNAT
jgi:hypothetical protein